MEANSWISIATHRHTGKGNEGIITIMNIPCEALITGTGVGLDDFLMKGFLI